MFRCIPVICGVTCSAPAPLGLDSANLSITTHEGSCRGPDNNRPVWADVGRCGHAVDHPTPEYILRIRVFTYFSCLSFWILFRTQKLCLNKHNNDDQLSSHQLWVWIYVELLMSMSIKLNLNVMSISLLNLSNFMCNGNIFNLYKQLSWKHQNIKIKTKLLRT